MLNKDGKLKLSPISLKSANDYVKAYHRHHKPSVGHKFSIGAEIDLHLVGVVIVGRPVSRIRDDAVTLEVLRLCTTGLPNVCSFLYGAAARAAFSLGYRRIGTYTLPSEGGASLRAAGWSFRGEAGGGSWAHPERPLSGSEDLGVKWLWERVIK